VFNRRPSVTSRILGWVKVAFDLLRSQFNKISTTVTVRKPVRRTNAGNASDGASNASDAGDASGASTTGDSSGVNVADAGGDASNAGTTDATNAPAATNAIDEA
tara:strand:+ start:1707 stop:2018 length:312 start_codon:yes stop_codon:yes gene_type:complete